MLQIMMLLKVCYNELVSQVTVVELKTSSTKTLIHK